MAADRKLALMVLRTRGGDVIYVNDAQTAAYIIDRVLDIKKVESDRTTNNAAELKHLNAGDDFESDPPRTLASSLPSRVTSGRGARRSRRATRERSTATSTSSTETRAPSGTTSTATLLADSPTTSSTPSAPPYRPEALRTPWSQRGGEFGERKREQESEKEIDEGEKVKESEKAIEEDEKGDREDVATDASPPTTSSRISSLPPSPPRPTSLRTQLSKSAGELDEGKSEDESGRADGEDEAAATSSTATASSVGEREIRNKGGGDGNRLKIPTRKNFIETGIAKDNVDDVMEGEREMAEGANDDKEAWQQDRWKHDGRPGDIKGGNLIALTSLGLFAAPNSVAGGKKGWKQGPPLSLARRNGRSKADLLARAASSRVEIAAGHQQVAQYEDELHRLEAKLEAAKEELRHGSSNQ